MSMILNNLLHVVDNYIILYSYMCVATSALLKLKNFHQHFMDFSAFKSIEGVVVFALLRSCEVIETPAAMLNVSYLCSVCFLYVILMFLLVCLFFYRKVAYMESSGFTVLHLDITLGIILIL